MKKKIGLVGLVLIIGAALGAWVWTSHSKGLIKEDVANAVTSPEVKALEEQRQELLSRIKQLKPGGTLAGRLIDLEARKDQLVRNYPQGHADIKILDQQIQTTKVALKKLPALQSEYSILTEKLELARSKSAAESPTKISAGGASGMSAFALPRLRFEGKLKLTYSGDAGVIDQELAAFRAHPAVLSGELVILNDPQQKTDIFIRGEDASRKKVEARLLDAARLLIALSLEEQKHAIHQAIQTLDATRQPLEARFNRLTEERKALMSGPVKNSPKSQIIAKVETLKARRRLLIDNYPTHSDIPLLALQIKSLLAQTSGPSTKVVGKLAIYDRQMNETKVWMDYLKRRSLTLSKEMEALPPAWKVAGNVQSPAWPKRVEGWPVVAAFGLVGIGVIGFFVYRRKRTVRGAAVADGLWKSPEVAPIVTDETKEAEPTQAAPVALEVVSPELPSDPLTEKAASLYSRWMEVAKVLYTPAAEPPVGILESVQPLLQESCEFLPSGHDVLARYLALSVEPGNLPAHVARTVLMALTGAEEAGVAPEHRLAMALAALFHDLAVVPRPSLQQDEIGSEVGRLSASLLRRIPGLDAQMLAMVEDILIGMDEFKLETWQNVSTGKSLEPLSKVLREIDRFEKVLQKQKARMTRQLKAASGS